MMSPLPYAAANVSSPSRFFFQAEDVIRYPLVTGVQTCALPIFAGTAVDKWIAVSEFLDRREISFRRCRNAASRRSRNSLTAIHLSTAVPATITASVVAEIRSEERRVVKDWSTRERLDRWRMEAE